MDINQFVTNFAGLFDETDPSLIHPDTKFRDLDEWSSLVALSIIAMADEEYGVTLGGNDIVNSQTVEDIFNIVKSRA